MSETDGDASKNGWIWKIRTGGGRVPKLPVTIVLVLEIFVKQVLDAQTNKAVTLRQPVAQRDFGLKLVSSNGS